MNFEIRNAERCKSLDALVKRLARGEVVLLRPRPGLHTLLPGDTVVCGSKTYKVTRKLNIELRDVPQYCEEVASLDFIDKLTREECQIACERIQARCRQLVGEDPHASQSKEMAG